MRKRSKYRPKPQYANPVEAVLEKITPVPECGSYFTDLLAKNHAAMLALTRGEASRHDMNVLIGMSNVAEGLWRMKGLGRDFEDRLTDGFQSLKALCERHARDGRVTVRAAEMEALNALLELHDNQLQCITLDDMYKVLKFIRTEERAGRTHRITSVGL